MSAECKQLITQHSTFIIRRRRSSGELRIEDAEKWWGRLGHE